MSQIKILYAEDYDLVLFTVKQLLELEGWGVDYCRDGAAALKKLEGEELFDLIVLDCDMPGVHGMDLLRAARTLEHRAGTPVIIFSAEECEREVMEAGADAYLKKPGGIKDLVHTIERLLYGRGEQSDAEGRRVTGKSI